MKITQTLEVTETIGWEGVPVTFDARITLVRKGMNEPEFRAPDRTGRAGQETVLTVWDGAPFKAIVVGLAEGGGLLAEIELEGHDGDVLGLYAPNGILRLA